MAGTASLTCCIRGGIIFLAVFLFAIAGLPLLVFLAHDYLDNRVENFLMFWPQFALLPNGLNGDFGGLLHITVPLWLLGRSVYLDGP